MMKKTIWIGLIVSGLGFLPASGASAGQSENKKTALTFNQPVEIPGHVLPTGTYIFRLADSATDRHIVQILNADESQIIATLLAVPDYRLKPTDETVIRFGEVPAGSPEAIRAWFFPGDSIGQAFVYPKARAGRLAKASNAVVPALAVDVYDVNDLKTAPIVAITPEEKVVPVAAVIQTIPLATIEHRSADVIGTMGVDPARPRTARTARHLPKTASALPLVVLLGLGSITVAVGLMVFGRRAAAPIM